MFDLPPPKPVHSRNRILGHQNNSALARGKKRPLKRAGVKPNGARLYKRFLAGRDSQAGEYTLVKTS